MARWAKQARRDRRPRNHIAACDYCDWERRCVSPEVAELRAVRHGLDEHPELCQNDSFVVALRAQGRVA